MKIAHLSDIHFYHTDWSFQTLFSKSLLGTLNHALNPHRKKQNFNVFDLPDVLKSLEVEWVLISGDWTTTSNTREYKEAKKLLEAFKNKGMKVLTIPGNHDHYTLKAEREKRFYHYLEAPLALKEKGFCLLSLDKHYSCLMLDTTLATPLWSSQGCFKEALEKQIEALLKALDAKAKVIVMNHFPALQNERPHRHQMLRKEKLKELLEQYPQIKVYLYGHTHRSEFSFSQNPIHINCGSLTLTSNGSFHLMDLTDQFLEVKVYHYVDESWQIKAKKVFPMENNLA